MADIGNASLILALIFASYSAVVSIANLSRKNSALAASARNALITTFILFTLAIEIMLYALITNDFDIKLVALHSSEDMPLIYKLTALYADKAGSLMFWGWIISLFAMILTFQKRKTSSGMMQSATGILAIILAFFLILITIGVDVFEKSPMSVTDGFGQTYQNIAMIIHPLLLFLGFAGSAIVFAFVFGAFVQEEKDRDWIGGIRRWTLFSWCTIGLANLVGAWWALDAGNWGGYWAWDPVENAGLMPWLLATALVHSIAIQRKRRYLKLWCIVLAMATFIFTLVSPFITHGGLKESPLHGFDNSPIPPYILSFIVITITSSISIIIWRRKHLADEKKSKSLLSREGAFLFINLILVVVVLIVFLGTITPGIADYLGNRDMDVDRSFFDWAAGPVLLLLVFFMGICPLFGWSKTSPGMLKHNSLFPFIISSIMAILVLISGVGTWYALATFICSFPFCTILQEWTRGTRARHRTKGEYPLKAFGLLIWKNRSRYGGFIVHIGIILITFGVIGSSLHSDGSLVNAMWTGGGVLLFGTIIAFWPDRKPRQI